MSRTVCLVVDREGQFGPEWRSRLCEFGFDLIFSPNVKPGVPAPRLIIVVQQRHDPGDAWGQIDAARGRFPAAPVLLASSSSSGAWTLAAVRLQTAIQVRANQTYRDVAKLIEELLPPADDCEMVGDSPALERTRGSIARVAPSEASVLITGESGTGKELVAEMIHRASRRSHGPFVCVNCAAIPDGLIESELFGFQKGAFTGADSSRDGRFSEADGGTLFLDEIGDMSQYAQAKILRAIETRRVERLGSRTVAPVDIRIIAATNRDLEQMVAAGTFRQDLYFRLNVFEISLPPLRERLKDVPALVSHYLKLFNHRFCRRVEGLADEVLPLLCGYSWPGNVRELRNFFEAVYVNELGRMITLADLPESFTRRVGAVGCEKERLLAALEAANWNKSQAAKSLRWSRVTLYRKLARHRLVHEPALREDQASEKQAPERQAMPPGRAAAPVVPIAPGSASAAVVGER